MRVHLHHLGIAMLVASSVALWADGGSSSSGSSSKGSSGRVVTIPVDRFAAVRAYMTAKKWPEAIAELRKIGDSKSADWNNLMGFCSRRSDPPDLAAAERYYQAALALNPKHLGTLEYLGEMRLQQGNLPGAESQLEALRKATFFKSREFTELQEAIAQYKSTGHYTMTD